MDLGALSCITIGLLHVAAPKIWANPVDIAFQDGSRIQGLRVQASGGVELKSTGPVASFLQGSSSAANPPARLGYGSNDVELGIRHPLAEACKLHLTTASSCQHARPRSR